MIKILIVHGPNLNLLGEREPEIYGAASLDELNRDIAALAQQLDVEVEFYQSNHEGALIDYLHARRNEAQGIVINPGALTHYSYALRDAIAGVRLPTVEVHLSDIHRREPFRRISVTKEVCLAQFSGKGKESYFEGLRLVVDVLRGKEKSKVKG